MANIDTYDEPAQPYFAKNARTYMAGFGVLVAALFVLSVRRKRLDKKDVTGTFPSGKATGAASPIEQKAEEGAIMRVVAEKPVAFYVGDEAIDAGIPGVDELGNVRPLNKEWRSGYYARAAFMLVHYPVLQLPAACILENTCPHGFIPLRNSALRILESTKAYMARMNVKDARYNAATGEFR